MAGRISPLEKFKNNIAPAIDEYLNSETDVEKGIQIVKGLYEQYRDDPLMSILLSYVLSELCMRAK